MYKTSFIQFVMCTQKRLVSEEMSNKADERSVHRVCNKP